MIYNVCFRLAIILTAFSCLVSSRLLGNPFFIPNPILKEKKIEYFVESPQSHQRNPVIIFIHGHQPEPRSGGKVYVKDGTLKKYAERGFIAVAVSQPGYGSSDGPPDFCGPISQAAVREVISTLKKRPDVNPHMIFLYGVSRGALVASMVATQEPSLKGAILDAGFYNLRAVRDQRTLTNLTKETRGMIKNIENEASLKEEAMHLRSAIDFITQIKSPILMFHGSYDNRAPVNQAIHFYQELSKKSIPVQLHLFDCGHHTPKDEKEVLIQIFLKERTT